MHALFAGQSPATGRTPFEPAVIAGTSAGAFNAALFCSLPPGTRPMAALDYLRQIWLDRIAGKSGCGNNVLRLRGNPIDWLETRCASPARRAREISNDMERVGREMFERMAAFSVSSAELQQRLIESFDASLVIATDRFVELVRETVRLDNVRRSPHALRVAATNWRTGELRVFANADMTDAMGHRIVLASAAIPGVFDTVEIEGSPFADGGLVMNTPLGPAIDAGANSVHMIYMDPAAERIPLPRLRSTASTLYRASVIVQAAAINRDIEIALRVNRGLDVLEGRVRAEARTEGLKGRDYVLASATRASRSPYRRVSIHRYHPTEDPGGTYRWLSFDHDRMARLLERGYRDAVAHDCGRQRCVLQGD
jgi:predicted acylesterase/phospholipase RssA